MCGRWWITRFSSQTHRSVCRPQLKGLWPEGSPPVGMSLVGQISPPTGSLPTVRGATAWLICLLLRPQIECVHTGCVNGQKCSGGTWCAGLVKRNFSHSMSDCLHRQNFQFISAIMSGVRLLGRRLKLRYFWVIYLHSAHVSVFLWDNLRTLEMCSIPSYFHFCGMPVPLRFTCQMLMFTSDTKVTPCCCHVWAQPSALQYGHSHERGQNALKFQRINNKGTANILLNLIYTTFYDTLCIL